MFVCFIFKRLYNVNQTLLDAGKISKLSNIENLHLNKLTLSIHKYAKFNHNSETLIRPQINYLKGFFLNFQNVMRFYTLIACCDKKIHQLFKLRYLTFIIT